jgi:hypothetical protein
MDFFEHGYDIKSDYRMRIVTDWDNPILACRANRNRYTNTDDKQNAGFAHLGGACSDDAITWNVFRTFQKYGQLNTITSRLGLGEPRGLLIWAAAPELDDNNAMLQHLTGSILRKIDGIFPGQIIEPDVVILGTTGVAVGVLGTRSDKEKTGAYDLWEGEVEKVRHIRKCLGGYEKRNPVILTNDKVNEENNEGVTGDNKAPNVVKHNPGIIKNNVSDEEMANVYQLVKMALLAKELGSHFKVEPLLVSLANSRQWKQNIPEIGKSPNTSWNTFNEMLGENALRCDVMFWQHFLNLSSCGSLRPLHLFLLKHPALFDIGPAGWASWNMG